MKHLTDNNITYFEHLKRAFKMSGISAMASVLLFVHGIAPFLFEYSGSNMLKKALEISKGGEKKD